MSMLFANPYDLSKTGFFFESVEEYSTKAEQSGAEEFSIEFNDGEDSQLFEALSIHQCDLDIWFDQIECLDENHKAALFYLCSDLGYSCADALTKLDDVSLQEGSLLDAATELFDECYGHEVPEAIRNYIDYEAFARDCELGGDMSAFQFAGKDWVVTNAANI